MTDEEKRGGVYLPAWTLGVLVALFLSAAGWTANTLLETRETQRVHGQRLTVLEQGVGQSNGVPVQLARLESSVTTTLKGLEASVAELREDVRRIRTPTPERR